MVIIYFTIIYYFRHKTFWSAKIDRKPNLLRCRSETSLLGDNFLYPTIIPLCSSTSNLTPRPLRAASTNVQSVNDSQSTSDIEPFDSSDSGSPISSSPLSQPDETLLQVIYTFGTMGYL